MAKAERFEWPDVLRGLAMILVVAGHALVGLENSRLIPHEGAADFTLLLFYAAHMPIVFFVSGFVSRDAKKPIGDFLLAMALWIALPYALWSTILVVAQNLSPGGVNARIGWGALLDIGWKPITLFWFLHTLLIIKLVHYALGRLLGELVAVLLLLSAAVVGNIWLLRSGDMNDVMRHVVIFLLFYEVGALAAARPAALAEFLAQSRPRLALVAAISAASLAAVARLYQLGALGELRPVWDFQSGVMATGLIATFGTLAFAGALRGGKALIPIKTVGVYSMAIYVQHVIIGAAARSALVKVGLSNPWGLAALITLAGLVAPILWQLVFDRLRLTRYFGIRPANA